jgi:DNA-binding NarL/FixJ family response regulator
MTITIGPVATEPRIDPRPRPVRVAVVDDNDDLRELLRLWLEGEPDFELVGEAADGHGAVQLARATQPDVVVLDVDMPVMSGLDALPLLRAVSPATKVILYSAKDRRLEALAAGATTYLSKSASLPSIIDTVRRTAGSPMRPGHAAAELSPH